MIEGILIRKTPFQERHVMGNVLLRNGKSLSVLFYGGQGGGKKSKPSTLELGHLFSITASPGKNYSDIIRAKEWSLKWSHINIRQSYKKYVNLCLFIEIISKIIIGEDFDSSQKNISSKQSEFSGAYKVLSNAIYFLDKNFNDQHNSFILQSFFISKLLIELGVFPNLRECLISGHPLDDKKPCILLPDQGGFASLEELEQEAYRKSNHQKIRFTLSEAASKKWSEFEIEKNNLNQDDFQILLNYFCFQMNFEIQTIKSLQSII